VDDQDDIKGYVSNLIIQQEYTMAQAAGRSLTPPPAGTSAPSSDPPLVPAETATGADTPYILSVYPWITVAFQG
jgi:hypothetical protein